MDEFAELVIKSHAIAFGAGLSAGCVIGAVVMWYWIT